MDTNQIIERQKKQTQRYGVARSRAQAWGRLFQAINELMAAYGNTNLLPDEVKDAMYGLIEFGSPKWEGLRTMEVDLATELEHLAAMLKVREEK